MSTCLSFGASASGRARVRCRAILIGGALAIGFSSSGTAGPAALAGHVEDVRGYAYAQGAAGQRTLEPAGRVFVGDNVATSESSRAGMHLGRDTTLRMGANAKVRLDRFLVDAGGVVTLNAGPVLLDKAPGAPKAPVKLRSPYALIAIRGTRIFAGPSNGVFGVFVVHGKVEVTSGGAKVTLADGEGTDIAAPGHKPTAPKRWGEARIEAALGSVD